MNVVELERQLAKLGVNDSAYSICDEVGDEQYCIEKDGGKWHYFYSARGQRSGEKIFQNENEACEYVLSLLKEDPTVKN